MNIENMTNSERFINAFTILENEMNRRIKSDRYISYSELVRRMAGMDSAYHRYQRYLEEFGDLRNAIVHERIDGEVIAEPHLKEVQRIEQIAELLTRPELLSKRFVKNVQITYEDETLKQVLSRMMPAHYSKLPVYSKDGNFKGLLTTDILSYVMYSQPGYQELTVLETLKLDEKARAVSFLPIESTIMDAINEFERSLERGKRLNAIILTKDGATNQKPLGIITISDLPLLYQAIHQ